MHDGLKLKSKMKKPKFQTWTIKCIYIIATSIHISRLRCISCTRWTTNKPSKTAVD